MSDRAELFLGIIAVATLITAIIQVGVLIVVGLLVRRIQRVIVRAETDLRPVFDSVNAIARDASRAAAVATAQVERADRLFADAAKRFEDTMVKAHDTVSRVHAVATGPIREGAAVLAAFQAVMHVLRDFRTARPGAPGEDEDALFI